jgi:hypothetical protein
MKNNLTYFLIAALLILGGTAYYMFKNSSESSSSIDIRDRKFAVEKKEDVAKILIAQRNGKKVVLEKKGNQWFVDDEYLVHPNFMSNMLDVISNMEMKYIPPRSAYDNMMKAIGRVGVKVEVYDALGEQLRAYQVGGTTAGELGTVFLMDGYTQPYVMELENFEGSLRGRFLIDNIDQIRDRTVFSYDESDIKEVAIHYPKDSKRSFRLQNNGSGEFALKPFSPDGYIIKGNVKPGAIERFIRSFQDVDAEAFENQHPLKDSIQTLLPLAEISVTNQENEVKSVKLFPMIDVFNADINTRSVDVDKRVERYFADCSWGEFMIVQHLLFSKILWRYEEFF